MRPGKPFPISPVGWVGIAAAMVGLAYFILPDGTSDQSRDRRPLPDARIDAPQTPANRYEVVSPAGQGKAAGARSAAAKQAPAASKEEAAGVDAPRAERKPAGASVALPP